ncbi:NADPH:quinone reductase [Lutimaribacter marinistellae]|uniref:NADPH:quinone reductase n=1 Tax=Lutimaribacter marinistellae TaxID=1820329 RepID=A0ABV7TE96_9RHOB
MHAITYRRFGPAREVLTLEELETPAPGPGEVLVELAFSGVNPSDVKARAGSRPGVTEPPYPVIIPHSDGAGEIVAVGDGVDRSRVGQRVWVWNGQWRRAFGTAASHIALPAAQAVPLPGTTSFETGATLGIPGQTATHTVFHGGPVEGRSVLIHGGGGTVGFLAVQLARWGGARVIATSSPRDFDRLRDAGADSVLDYSDPELAQAILAANDGQPVERIVEVEFGVNAATDAEVIAEAGQINAYGSAKSMNPVVPFYALMFKAVTLHMALIYLLTDAQRAETARLLTRALEADALFCPVDQVYPMSDCAAAHEAVEAGGRSGSVLVETRA